MPKYKFILTLPYDWEVDSTEEIEGHVSWPNWSQADPVVYKGIFDSYDEAKDYASEVEIYKYILMDEDGPYYDSYEDEDECPKYYLSIFDAEDAATEDLDSDPADDKSYELKPIEILHIEIEEIDE